MSGIYHFMCRKRVRERLWRNLRSRLSWYWDFLSFRTVGNLEKEDGRAKKMTEMEVAGDGGVVNGGETELHVENGGALKQQPVVPTTYGVATPYFMISPPKAAEAIVFYTKAFGAEEVEKMYVPKRKAEQDEPLIRHAHLRFGETNIFVADEAEVASTEKSAANGPSFLLHLETSDVDAAVARAVEAGATVTMEVANQYWGARFGIILDPYGYSWGLSTPLPKDAEIPAEPPVEAGHAA